MTVPISTLPSTAVPPGAGSASFSPSGRKRPILTPQDTEVLARGFLEDPEWNRLQQRGDVDFAYANDFGRYRASVVKQRLGYDICFRIINTRVRTMEEIGLPTEYVVPLTRYTNGLILVTGFP